MFRGWRFFRGFGVGKEVSRARARLLYFFKMFYWVGSWREVLMFFRVFKVVLVVIKIVIVLKFSFFYDTF